MSDVQLPPSFSAEYPLDHRNIDVLLAALDGDMARAREICRGMSRSERAVLRRAVGDVAWMLGWGEFADA